MATHIVRNTGRTKVSIGIISFALLMCFYGLLAIDAGQKLIYESNFVDREALHLERVDIRAMANKGEVIDDSDQPVWTQLVSLITSQKHIFGTDSYFDTHVYLAYMPSVDALILGVHATLAGICMLFGAIQFSPSIRRRYPIWHRRLGKTFVYLGLVSMGLSVIYLLRTSPENTFGGLTFHLGLWFLAISVSGSLLMAVYHIRKREILQHQVYMALAYGLMLSAPLLRYDWMALGIFLHQELSFNEINYAVNAMLVPQCFLIAYLLVLFNRPAQKRTQEPIQSLNTNISRTWIIALGVLSAACISTVFSFYSGDYASNSESFKHMVPLSVWINHTAAINEADLSRMLFLFTSCIALFSYPILLMSILRMPSKHRIYLGIFNYLTWLFAISISATGMVLLYWAWLLGLPSHATSSAGTGYILIAFPCLVFGLLMCWARYKGNIVYYIEWSVFSILFLASPAEFVWVLKLLEAIDLPQQYIDQGHAYTIASAAGPAMAMTAFFYLAHGQTNYKPLSPVGK